ncbi:hypothetical protein [Staphylococcus epidermidis]|uniref:hypothetical protein n=1 Tax=Staphylococcus epidermidis TaxID=1282 RepID=UPI0007D960B7|nr:hypothetical protein [Staphylococcus epidermidis]OAO18685.1 hypothetical protein AXY35_10820 [Staphylococcus epidermidis]
MTLKVDNTVNQYIYVADQYLNTLLTSGKIEFKQSKYSEAMEYNKAIAKYEIVKKPSEQQSKSDIHVHIASISVYYKRHGIMTLTFAYLIYQLLKAYPHQQIEVTLHHSGSEVSYKEKDIYHKLLSKVYESNAIPLKYEVFTTKKRQDDLVYYQQLIQRYNYEIVSVNMSEYQRLNIDIELDKKHLLYDIKQMLWCDITIHQDDKNNMKLKEIKRVMKNYKSIKRIEKRISYMKERKKSVKTVEDSESASFINSYELHRFQYDLHKNDLNSKEIKEVILAFKEDTKQVTDINEMEK